MRVQSFGEQDICTQCLTEKSLKELDEVSVAGGASELLARGICSLLAACKRTQQTSMDLLLGRISPQSVRALGKGR